ncbi:MAG: DUF6056 family protein [Clostridia bacterium]|nr:DUF6056 family protein [Clostridia bacterium]
MKDLSKVKDDKFSKMFFWITVAIVAIIYFIRLAPFELYGDDYLYEKAAVCNLPQIVQFIKWHIMNYNGRTFVHILCLIFLRNKATILLWKAITSFMLPFTCFVVSRAATQNRNDAFKYAVYGIAVMFLTGPVVYCESVYWLIGSFNYFYPVVGIIATMILYKNNPSSVWLFPIAFILSATTEQCGIMAVGLFVILFLAKLIQEGKIDKRLIVQIIFAIAGYLTDILSPGTSARMDKQGNPGIAGIIYNIFIVFRDNWFSSLNMFVILTLLTASMIYWLIKVKRLNKFTKKANVPLAVFLGVVFAGNTGLIALSIVANHFIAGFTLPTALSYAVFVVWVVGVTMFFAVFAYTTLLIFFEKKTAIPFISFALGTGSQMVMGITAKPLFRACVPAIFMYMVFLLFTLAEVDKDDSPKLEKIRNIKIFKPVLIRAAVCFGCVVLCAIHAFLITHFMTFGKSEEFGEITPMTEQEMTEFTNRINETNKEYYQKDWEASHKLTDFSKY